MLNYKLLSDESYAALRYQLLLNVEETGNPKSTTYLDSVFYTMFICLFAFMPTSIVSASQQPKICADIHKLLIQRQQGRAPAGFVAESQEQQGGDNIYPKLDIDGDGSNDLVVRSCGASIEALCFLFITLSSGKQLELEEERFILVRIESNIYVIVGESLSQPETAKLGKRRAYQVTDQAIKLICPAI